MESRERNPRCTLCDLHANCHTVCMQPEGPQNAKIFMVGQWPQDEDDNAKRGFVGDAGRKLMYLLGKAGLRRKDIFLTHLVRCNPRKETPKKKPHIDPCLPYLLHEIKTHQPKIILTLGDKPTKAILGSNIKLKEWAGFPIWHTFDIDGEEYDCWVMPMHSPLAALNSWELDSIIVRDLEVAQRYANGEKVYNTPKVPYTLIGSPAELKDLLWGFAPNSRVTMDTETTGLSHATDNIIDIGWYDGTGMAYILPLLDRYGERKWDDQTLREYASLIFDFLTDPKCRIGGQNFKYDLLMMGMWIIKTLGLDMFTTNLEVPKVWDVGSMHHVLDENKPHNLTFMLKWFFYWDKYDHAMDPYKGTKRGKPKKKKEVNYSHAPNQMRYEYLARDLKGTHDLAELLEPQVYQQGLGTVYETEVGLTNYLLPPQLIGIRFDKQKTEELVAVNQERAKGALDFLRQVHHTLYGETEKPFNPNSQKQLAKLLQDVGASLKKRTKGGHASTGKNVLKSLVLQDDELVKEVARNVQTLRSANKLLSTYLNGNTVDCSSEDGEIKEKDSGFLPFVDPDGRIRPTYNIALTVSGRLSANDPALQTMPKKHDIRDQIVPDDEDSVFLSSDYGKVELCVLAWCANDDVMATELINKVDLHAKTVIGVDLKRPPTDEEFERLLPQYKALPDWEMKRSLGKATSFGVPYFITAEGLVDNNPENFDPDMPYNDRVELAQSMIDAYFSRYSSVKTWLDGQFDKVMKTGTLTTIFTQRQRRFHDAVEWLKSPWGKRISKHQLDMQRLQAQSCNFEIQSTASDELSRATKRVYEGLKKCKIPKFRIVFSLHDQFMFNCHKDYVEEAKILIRSWMETTFPKDEKHKYEVPFYVDIKEQRFWGDNEY